jgi:hypothetical protein
MRAMRSTCFSFVGVGLAAMVGAWLFSYANPIAFQHKGYELIIREPIMSLEGRTNAIVYSTLTLTLKDGRGSVSWSRAEFDFEHFPFDGWRYGVTGWQKISGRANPLIGTLPSDLAGFRVFYDDSYVLSPPGRTKNRAYTIPLWAPTAVLIFWPAGNFVRWGRKRLRERTGRCQTCGYDMRASLEKCPECGATGKDRRITDTVG